MISFLILLVLYIGGVVCSFLWFYQWELFALMEIKDMSLMQFQEWVSSIALVAALWPIVIPIIMIGNGFYMLLEILYARKCDKRNDKST